jgi:aspartate oxidase
LRNHRDGDRNRCKQTKKNKKQRKTKNGKVPRLTRLVRRRRHTVRTRSRVQRNVNTLELRQQSKQSYNNSKIDINSSTNEDINNSTRRPETSAKRTTARDRKMRPHASSTQIIGLSWLRTPYGWIRGSEVSPEGMRPNRLPSSSLSSS